MICGLTLSTTRPQRFATSRLSVRDVDAVGGRELVEALAARRRCGDPRGGHVTAAHEAANQRLGHVAGADEPDRV